MNEKPYIEKLKVFAKETGLEYYTNSTVKNNVLIPDDKFSKSEYVIFDLPHTKNNLHLIFSDRLSSRVGSSSVYCGLFLMVRECKNEVKIKRRFFIDSLSFEKRHKTGNSFTDKNVTIYKSSKESLPIKTDYGIIRKFLDLNKAITPIELVSIKNSLSFIPLLHGKNWIALLINGSWLLEIDKLKTFVNNGSEILRKANKAY